MVETTEAKVDDKASYFVKMASKWDLLDDLIAGTARMRQVGKKWLPQEPREKDEAYTNRVKRSFLYGAFSDAVDRIVAKPFSIPVTFTGATPDLFNEMIRNVDNCGNDLTLFSRAVFEDGVIHGLSYILVDHPATGGKLTAKAERDLKIRPYFVHVKSDQLIGHRCRRNGAGEKVLTQVRIYGKSLNYVGKFGEEEVESIRVITEDGFEIWEKKDDDKEFSQTQQGEHTFGGVPLVPFYTNSTGFMTADPPLEDVAWMNLAHWQSYSDQRNILRFARVGILFGSGFTEDEIENGFSIGPTNMILSANEAAKLEVVEHSGRAIGAGKDDLEELEAKMDSLGLRPFLDQKGNPTATGKAIDEAKSYSSILSWIRSLEMALRTAFEFAARWRKITVSEDFDVDVFSDFGISVQTYEAIQNLTTARANREISRQTYLEEIKRRGLIADTVKVDEEIQRIESEPPPAGLTAFGNDVFGDDDLEDDEEEDATE